MSEEEADAVVEIMLNITIEVQKELARVAGTPEGQASGFDWDEFPFRGTGSYESLLRSR